jgi:uncharacterized membrane protein YeaQ/YmgE (transglycosylase-associated protein family)
VVVGSANAGVIAGASESVTTAIASAQVPSFRNPPCRVLFSVMPLNPPRERPRSFAGSKGRGRIAGFIGSKLVNSQGQGLWLDIVLGIVGAIVGGFLFSIFGAEGITGFNIYSMIVAIVGSVVVLWIYHALVGRRV